jgi:hypothetical protein
MFHVPEQYRFTQRGHFMRSTYKDGNNGAFLIPMSDGSVLRIIASDGEGWEHVSVSIEGAQHCPFWEQMCFVKNLFWDEEDCVVQFHPPKSEYINCHKYCLHLWRPTAVSVPTPYKYLVGI